MAAALRTLITYFFLILVSLSAAAAEFHVSPAGTAGGDGSEGAPWDIVTAFGHPGAVQPGDTIWLRGGTYVITGGLSSWLAGSDGNPIIVRQYPGERAALDVGADQNNRVFVNGAYTWFWGFEIMSSASDRWAETPPSTGLDRGYSIDVYTSTGIKLINLVIHDTGGAIGCWSGALDAEVYGCLIYYNGYDASDRGHGHAIYAQNTTGRKYLTDNIFFGQYSHGIHVYTEGGRIDYFTVAGNIAFRNGAVSTISGITRGILIGGGPTAIEPEVFDNCTYDSSIGIDCGYGGGVQDLTMTGNCSVSGTAFNLDETGTAVITGNTFCGTTPGCSSGTYPSNTFNGSTAPAGTQVFVRPNQYETGRAHIAVYNWDGLAAVNADLSGCGLANGDSFEIRDSQNYFGAAVTSGTYSGAAVSIPMTATAVAAVIGTPAAAYTHTPTQFGAFILVRTGAVVPDGGGDSNDDESFWSKLRHGCLPGAGTGSGTLSFLLLTGAVMGWRMKNSG